MHKAGAHARIVLATLNARYIHASLGLRYLLANLDRHGEAGLRAQAVLREYTVSKPASAVVADLLATLGEAGDAVQIVGFSVTIWNVTQTQEVIRQLKAMRPAVTVVLGGPEVSHETAQQPIIAWADFVITGWGDVSFAKLCRALTHGPRPLNKIIPGEQPPLQDMALPYDEYSAADLAHRLLYVEASRGCPFKCEFCLSSLDQTAWAFELDRVLAALDALYQRGARTFKFVDRTFNLKVGHAARILQFFLDKLAPHTVAQGTDAVTSGARPVAGLDAGGPAGKTLFLHFEVIPDHLPERLKTLLARFPPGVLQLEVGVQSFNPEVQHTLSRRQDNAATEANLRWLLAHTHAHLHADLIFGLPGETLHSFADGFDRLLAIGPHEIQLGILKRLRGTPIARHTAAHGMVYDPAPPYTVQRTGVVDADTVQRFSRLARYWDLLANSGRFAQTLVLALHTPPAHAVGHAAHSEAAWPAAQTSPFWRFWLLSEGLWQRLGSTHRLTPEVLVDALFDDLSQHLPPETVRQALLADYLASGARANPQVLQGLLPRQPPAPAKAARTLAARQERHQNTA